MFWAILVLLLSGGFLLAILVNAFKTDFKLGLLILVFFLILILCTIIFGVE